MSDIGWVVGHTFIVYGPLLAGAKSVVFEGKPITPNPGKVWEMAAKYKSKALFLAPTALRIIKKLDFDGMHIKNADLSSLETVFIAGERCDPATIKWLRGHLPDKILCDHWWQTESGWPIASKMLNTKTFGPFHPTLPGSSGRIVPGFDVEIVDDAGKKVGPNVLGNIVIKQPLPPSFVQTLWRND
jgi:propionyl-CoA synthetase